MLLKGLSDYLEHLCSGVGHARRHTSLKDYCRGLMLPLERKSVEPIAAAVAPDNVPKKHQSLHHFVADAPWSDKAVLERVHSWALPSILSSGTTPVWIVDDTGMPKKGKHSVGVQRQYCGQLGKRENCQVVVSLSVAGEKESLPLAYRLYLPEAWCEDKERCLEAGVPEGMGFQTKPQIALDQIREACQTQTRKGIVLADSAYGNDNAFRDTLEELELEYLVAIQPTTTIWPQGVEPLPPKEQAKTGRPAKRLRYAPGHEPQSVQEYCGELNARSWEHVTWREGSNGTLRSRFVAKRVRIAHRDYNNHTLREERWLLAEWLQGDEQPSKFWIGNLADTAKLHELVSIAKRRWHIERDYQELKQEFGINHYEGRGWRGLHHHWTLCIAAYAFTVTQRVKNPEKKNAALCQELALPEAPIPRGSPAYAASRQ